VGRILTGCRCNMASSTRSGGTRGRTTINPFAVGALCVRGLPVSVSRFGTTVGRIVEKYTWQIDPVPGAACITRQAVKSDAAGAIANLVDGLSASVWIMFLGLSTG
jgi:hypothetical protein